MGARTNIQDGSICTSMRGEWRSPGDGYVTIGHSGERCRRAPSSRRLPIGMARVI